MIEDPSEAGFRRIKRKIKLGRLHEEFEPVMWPWYLGAIALIAVYMIAQAIVLS